MANEVKETDEVLAGLNNENKVKLGSKMATILKNFAGKVVDGLTTVPYMPKVLFILAKTEKEMAKKQKAEKKSDKSFGERVNKVVANVVDKHEKERKKKAEEKSNAKADETTQKENTVLPVIQGKTLSDLKKQAKANPAETIATTATKEGEQDLPPFLAGYDEEVAAKRNQDKAQTNDVKENAPIMPIEITVSKDETKEEPENDKPKKQKKDVKDLTAFNSYDEYKQAYFYNYYMNKKSFDVEALEEFAKIMSKAADVTKFRGILTEAQFNAKRAEQVKEKEIAELNQAHTDEMTAAEEKRQADVQAAIDERQAEVDGLNEKLTDARSKNRTLTSKLKVNSEALNAIKEAVEPLGIAKIAGIISDAEKKCDGIDERAAKREKEKNESVATEEVKQDVNTKPIDIEAETNKIMNEINQNVYGDTSNKETADSQVTKDDDKKEIFSNLASVVSQAAEQKATQEEQTKPEETKETEPQESNTSLSDELDDMFKEETVSAPDDKTILQSTNPDYPGVMTVDGNGEVTANWAPSSITNDTNTSAQGLDYMGLTPEARAEVGQKAYDIFQNSDGKISFDDALNTATEEQQKGKHMKR